MISSEIQQRDISIPTPDGLTLVGRFWSRPDPRAIVVVAHGFGEHGGAYEHVAATIGHSAEVDFLAPDLRGHGRSPGARGFVETYDELTADLVAALDWAARNLPNIPRFVLGHSNGGQVALRAALDPEIRSKVAGFIVSNPSLKLATHVPRYKIILGRLLLRYAPSVTLGAPLATESMTSDPVMQQLHLNDGLRHGRISPRFYFGMIEGGAMIAERASEIMSPILMIVGGADPIVDPVETRAVFEKIGSSDKTLLLYPKMLHEPLNELGREKVFDDLSIWLRDRLG